MYDIVRLILVDSYLESILQLNYYACNLILVMILVFLHLSNSSNSIDSYLKYFMTFFTTVLMP